MVCALICAAPVSAGDAAPRPQITEVIVEGLPEGVVVSDDIIPQTPLLYDTAVVKVSIYRLSRLLSENGYPYNKITTSVINNSDDSTSLITHKIDDPSPSITNNNDTPASLTVRLTVDADERVRNGSPVVIGVKNPTIYLRDVRLVPGQLYNAADADETIRRLSMRPYTREALPGDPVIISDAPLSADGLRAAVVPFTITERRGLEAEGALGYESGRGGESGRLHGRLGLSLLNMLRGGENFAASYSGDDVTQRLSLSASRPWMFGLPLELGASAGIEIEDGGYGYMSGELWGAAEINAKWKYGAAVSGSETIPPDSIGNQYRFYGADIFIYLIQQQWERGRAVRELSIKTGSGVADREISYTRNRMELSAGIHQPVRHYAVAARVCAVSLFTDEKYLPPAEQYRIGGHGSLRGYSEDEFAFRAAVYSQIEGLYYFDRAGAVYLFTDGGAGFTETAEMSAAAARKMFGYGAGIRFPSRLGAVSVEWGRNLDDGRTELGRVHVGVNSAFSKKRF